MCPSEDESVPSRLRSSSSSCSGGQPQGKASQVVGDIFRKLLLPQLQSPAKLHGDLVALVHAQKRRQLQQGQAGAVAHRHPVAHLNKIRIMRRNVQHLGSACVGVLR